MKKERTVLLVVNNGVYFTGLFPLASFLDKTKEYKPVILFMVDYPTLEESIKECQAASIPFVRAIKEKKTNQFGRLFNYALFLARKPFLNSFFYLLPLGLWENARIKRLLKKIRPDIIGFCGDNIWYSSHQFIKMGHQLNVPSVVFPLFMASAREPAEAVFFNRDYDATRWWNKQVGKFFPKWIYKHKGKTLIRLPGSQVVAKELLKLSPPLPWILHSGFADAIAVESPFMIKYCKQEGLPSKQLRLVGSIQNDILAEGLKNEAKLKRDIYAKLGIKNSKPAILSAIPADFFSGVGGRPDSEFRSYEELVEFWVTSMTQYKDFNVIISLHPTANLEKMKFMEKWGAIVTKEPIINLIPICQFFTACVSSTIQWAAACKKPAIDYDVYKFRYTDYVNAPGIITVESKKEFSDRLKVFTEQGEYYKQVAFQAAENASYWGAIDKKSGDRTIELFNSLIAK